MNESTARSICSQHVLIPMAGCDNRFDDRINPGSSHSGRLPAFLPLPSAPPPPFPLRDLCLRFPLPRMNDRLLFFSVCMDASFFFCCSSSAVGPDYMIMHLPFSAQGLFFLSGACISGSFFSFSSTYSRILPRGRRRGSAARNTAKLQPSSMRYYSNDSSKDVTQ